MNAIARVDDKKKRFMRRHKYNACKCEEDGFKFDSKLERDTYLEVKRLQAKGAIASVTLQYRFDLKSFSGTVIGKYIADFYCLLPDGSAVVVEAKGMQTPIWSRTRKHFIADYPDVRLVEVRQKSEFPLDLAPPVPTKGRRKIGESAIAARRRKASL